MAQPNHWVATHHPIAPESIVNIVYSANRAILTWDDTQREKYASPATLVGQHTINASLAPEMFTRPMLEALNTFQHDYLRIEKSVNRETRLGLLTIQEYFPGTNSVHPHKVPLFTGTTFRWPSPPEAGSDAPLHFHGPFFTSLLRNVMLSDELTLAQKREIVESRLHRLLKENIPIHAVEFGAGGFSSDMTVSHVYDGIVIAMPRRDTGPTRAFLLGEAFEPNADGATEAAPALQTTVSTQTPLHGFVLEMPEDPQNSYFIIAPSAERKQALQSALHADTEWATQFKKFVQGVYGITQQRFQEFKAEVAAANATHAAAEAPPEHAAGEDFTGFNFRDARERIDDAKCDHSHPHAFVRPPPRTEDLQQRDAWAAELVHTLFVEPQQAQTKGSSWTR